MMSAKQSVVRISGDLVERDATPKPEESTSGLVLAQPMEFDGTHRLKAKQTRPRSVCKRLSNGNATRWHFPSSLGVSSPIERIRSCG